MALRTSLSKPSKVDRARERLMAAVARLEKALPDGTVEEQESAFEALEKEHLLQIAEMTADMQKLRDENARLLSLNKQASKRLDTAIGQFKQVIGE